MSCKLPTAEEGHWKLPQQYSSSAESHYTIYQQAGIWIFVVVTALMLMMFMGMGGFSKLAVPKVKKGGIFTEGTRAHLGFYLFVFALALTGSLSFFKDNEAFTPCK